MVLIAGGTGVTPFVAFMEDALVKGLAGEVWLHYGARSRDLLVFRDLAERCAGSSRRFTRILRRDGRRGRDVAGRIDWRGLSLCARTARRRRIICAVRNR